MFTLFFGVEAAANLVEVEQADRELFRRFFFGMLERGFYLPPSPFEAAFVSLAHTDADIQAFSDAAAETLLTVADSRA
jgi:glutamate-1-semialdehyde 2,1-aminomutase